MATAGSTGSINLTKKASEKVLERFKIGSMTEGLFSHEYNWTGVSTVQMYSVDNLPLYDYDPERVDGGSRFGNLVNVGDTVQEHTVRQKKSFIGAIDDTYNTQQLQIKRAGQILRRETDEVIIPHVDKYRLGVLAAAATSGNKNIASATLTTSNIIETIMSANAAMSDRLVPDTGRVCYMPYGRAVSLKLASQVVNIDKLGEKAIVNGVMGRVDKTQIRLVPAGYLPNGVEFMIVKTGISWAPQQIKSYEVHDGTYVLHGKIVTGLLQHDCFVQEGKESGIFVVTASGSSAISVVGTGVLTVTSGTATVSSGACAMTVAGGKKNVTVSTVSSGVVTGDVTRIDVSDETVIKARYNPDTGLIDITPLKAGTANLVVTANGKPGWNSPAAVTVAFTITAS